MNEILIEEDLNLKRAFAEGILKKPDKPLEVARSLTNDFRQAIQMANDWVDDEFVKEQKTKLIAENGEAHFLVSREDYARDVMDRANNIKDPDVAIKYLKLYGDIRGFIEKPQTNNNINVQNVTNRVMVVPTHAKTEDWEKGLLEQQRKLSNDSK